MSLLKQGGWSFTLLGFVFFCSIASAYGVPKKSYDKLLAVMAAPEKKAEQDTTPKRKYRYKRKVSGIKVVEIRHLEDEDWVEKLEVEIKNISDKPIYYIRFSITLDEIHLPPTYYPFGFTKIFGNDRHMNPGSLAEPDDESIKPGETFILKIPTKQVEGWKRIKDEHNLPPVTDVELYFEWINFGDGTGYFSGEPLSRKPKRVSSNNVRIEQVGTSLLRRSPTQSTHTLHAGGLFVEGD